MYTFLDKDTEDVIKEAYLIVSALSDILPEDPYRDEKIARLQDRALDSSIDLDAHFPKLLEDI